MATDYASAVRNGTMAATRLHLELGTKESLLEHGGSVDVFDAIFRLELPLLIRPLDGLLGAYIPLPIPGVLVTTERSLAIQRFTAGHELGHFRMKHLPSLDDPTILRRTLSGSMASGNNFQEVEANAFAVALLMPLWLILWHCSRQSWIAKDLAKPDRAYQLSLRLGASYEATAWTLQRYGLISDSEADELRSVQPRKLKVELLKDYRPKNYRGDVWALTARDGGTRICGSRNDHFVLSLNEHSGSGYLWDFDELKASGFAIVGDGRETLDAEGVGGPTTRRVTAAPKEVFRGHVSLAEARPWQPSDAISQMNFDYDFSGPEEGGLSYAERRRLLALS